MKIILKLNGLIEKYHVMTVAVLQVTESRMWDSKYTSPDCVYIRDTGFTESALRRVISVRPVLWSQDYHVMPIMDMKSLLKPVGVKVRHGLRNRTASFYIVYVVINLIALENSAFHFI